MHRTWAEIDLSRIAANFHALQAVVGPDVTLSPVVKADAYRHGAIPVAVRLAAEGAARFAVSCAAEGVQLREAGLTHPILVMGGFAPFEMEALAGFHLTPVIHSLAVLRDYDAFARARSTRLPYHLKVDTGMGRLGTRAELRDIIDAIGGAANLQLAGLMSHLASATDFTTSQTADQIRGFESIRLSLQQAGIEPPFYHLSSSAPIVFGMKPVFGNMVRPGLALYGYVSPATGDAPPVAARLSPALTWRARILEIKEISPGAPVGYSARWRAERPSRLAVVAAGYADGIPHTLSNKGHVVAAGRIVPITGAVSMDLTSIDITDCQGLHPGAAVTLIGAEGDASYSAEDMAREAGVISYSVLCGIGNRVARTYLD
ncbi:MAG: alanine racemase [Acidobacteria bacterium]|nr:alanine racemase [Acidobacteriota bacterium]